MLSKLQMLPEEVPGSLVFCPCDKRSSIFMLVLMPVVNAITYHTMPLSLGISYPFGKLHRSVPDTQPHAKIGVLSCEEEQKTAAANAVVYVPRRGLPPLEPGGKQRLQNSIFSSMPVAVGYIYPLAENVTQVSLTVRFPSDR